MNTENLSTLKIHKLTQAQYDRELAAGRIDSNAIYLTPEEEIDFPVDSVNGKTGAVTLSASDVGAAASSHNHSASNITSGTLAAARLPAATSSTLGGVKVGGNITNSSGTISLSKTNVTNALGYTPAQSNHNHAAGNITSGTLPVARGGTGVTSNPSMLTNLGSTSAASVFAASPRPGVTGVLPIANGGTGCSSNDNVLAALGLGAITATGSVTTTAMSANTVTKIELSSVVASTDKPIIFTVDTGDPSGSVTVHKAGTYLICGSVYIKTTAKSGTTYAQAASYIRKTVNGVETELVSGSIDINPTVSRDVCVSTGVKLVKLEMGAELTLHARTNNGVAGNAYPSNTGTYLTVIRLGS